MNIKNKIGALNTVVSILMLEVPDSNQQGGDHNPSRVSGWELEKQELQQEWWWQVSQVLSQGGIVGWYTVEMAREKAEVDENIFETKKIVGGLVVALSVVAGFRMAAYCLFSDQRGLVGVQVWRLWKRAGIPHLLPSQNAGEVAKRLGYGWAGVCWGVPVEARA
jgi:hypothetical protein